MQTALISAVTSAIVALLIEYFAKPSLEVRKDRLLVQARAKREFLETSSLLKSSLMEVSTREETGHFPVAGTELEAEFDRYFQELSRCFVRLRVVFPKSLTVALVGIMNIVEHQRVEIKFLIAEPESSGQMMHESSYRMVRAIHCIEPAFEYRRLRLLFRRRSYIRFLVESKTEFEAELSGVAS